MNDEPMFCSSDKHAAKAGDTLARLHGLIGGFDSRTEANTIAQGALSEPGEAYPVPKPAYI